MDMSLFHGNLVASNRILYTPSIFAKTNLIHLQEIGDLQAKSPHTCRRDNLSSYLFFLVLDGSGLLEYDGATYSLAKGDCIFLDCHKSYAHCTSDHLWELKWVHFYGPNMCSIYEKYVERGGRPYFHPNNLSEYEFILNQLYDIASSTDYIRDMRIFEKLTNLLTKLMEESWQPGSSCYNVSNKRNLQAVKDYLDQNYQDKIILDKLSEKFFINKFYLTRIFKEQFGTSINNYLTQIRITHAKQLLRFTELTIKEIGVKCGLSDENYLTRVFKKMEGLTPGEFRRMW